MADYSYRLQEKDLQFVRALPPKELPTFAVVVPSYNQAKFLPQTLDAVFDQNYPNIEIFVADGGSTDGSVAILEKYHQKYPQILRYVSEPDGGHRFAINKGIVNTSGEIIAWVNSDDVYTADAFWKVATAFYFNRVAIIFYGRNQYTDENLKPLMDYHTYWSPLLREQRRMMMHHCLPAQPSLFFRRTAPQLVGMVESDAVDYEMWLRWQRDLPFYYFDEYLSYSRLHNSAQTVAESCRLIRMVLEVVHRYYGTVPRSWAQTLAYHEKHGAAWTRTDTAPPPITWNIRAKGLYYWLLFNLKWSPRAVAGWMRETRGLLRESLGA